MDATARPDACHDVIVLGSGGAGLMAALVCAQAGLDTLLVERMEVLGGTTAMSGAGLWVPGNHLARAAGIDDGPEQTLRYLRAVAPEGWEAEELELWRAFAEAAPEMLRHLATHTRLRFELCPDPDPYPEAEGAGTHRMVSLTTHLTRNMKYRLQPTHIPHLITYREMRQQQPWTRLRRTVLRLAPRIAWRLATGRRGQGTGLVAGLLEAYLAAGGKVRTGLRARRLMLRAGAVRGVVAEDARGGCLLAARHGVVIATGGFERDIARREAHFTGPVDLVASSPGNTGDGHDMAEAAGARMARMDQANIAPALPARLAGRDQPIGTFHHLDPGAILVDRTGRRFVNEYLFNLGEVLAARDPQIGIARHLPAWIVADRGYLRRAPLLRRYLATRPDWLREAPDAAALAAQIGVEVDALSATLARFNADAARGVDGAFARHLEPGMGAQPDRLRPIRGPLVALPFNLSFLSTKGGPRTDAQGRVLGAGGQPIAGLYCAGVAMANPIGTRAAGRATTLGPNLTWAYICA